MDHSCLQPKPPPKTLTAVEVEVAGKAPTSSIQPQSSHDDNESSIMFGSTIANLFDAIQEALLNVIHDKVATLPFPDDGDNVDERTDKGESNKDGNSIGSTGRGREALTSILTSTYSRFVDLAEVYAKRYLFIIPEQEFTGRKKRRRMVESYVKKWEQFDREDGDTKEQPAVINPSIPVDVQKPNSREFDDKNNNDITDKRTMQHSIPTSPSQIPSRQEVAALDTQLLALRKNLHALNSSQSKLKSELSSLRNLRDSTKITTDAIERHLDNDRVHGAVEGVVDGREDLLDLFVVGDEVMHRMSDSARGGGKVEGETVEFGEAMKRAALEASRSRPKKKRLTTEEEFVKRQKEGLCLPNGGNTDGRKWNISNLFQKK